MTWQPADCKRNGFDPPEGTTMKDRATDITRRRSLLLAAAATGFILSGCQDVTTGMYAGKPEMQANVPPVVTPNPKGEVVGSGPVRVAMLLPSSVAGNGARIATEYHNAALLAMADAGMNSMQLVIKDTGGEAVRAQEAASEALSEGSSMVLGPVFSTSVSAAATVMRPSGRPMIGFSSDASVAGHGVYLLSFLPRTVVRRIAAYAVANGFNSMVAILPNGPYGDLALAELKRTLSASGGSLLGVARYDPTDQSIWAAAQSVAGEAKDASAIFVPEGGTLPVTVYRSLQGAGVKMDGKKLLGTGQWTTSDLSNTTFQGGWYADVDRSAFEDFKTRYKAAYNSDPTLNAGLGYDAVILAANLVKRYGATGITAQALETPGGFRGVTGLFRFMPDGTTERSLAVYEVSRGKTSIVSPAPASFTGSGS